MSIEGRKDAHIEICLNQEVESGVSAGLDGLALEYDALPEIDLGDVDLHTTFLGKRLSAPLIIGAMTGGTPRARQINERLARAAARLGVGMALGSQRAMVADPSLEESFAVRHVAPDLPLLIGNLGAVQLNLGVGSAQVRAALRAVDADAVNLHLNPLQEAIQPEGDTCFRGLQQRIGELATELDLPVLIKEVGSGISARTARKLCTLPVAGIEVAGVGGTSWPRVESYRARGDSARARAGQSLAGFGVPTARAIAACHQILPPSMALVASGGLRTGRDVAVALALGADLAALARPLLEAANESEEAVVSLLEAIIYELRVVCFCTGVVRPADLRRVRLLDSRGAVVPTGERGEHE